MDSEALIREIKGAFRDVPKPGRYEICDVQSGDLEAAANRIILAVKTSIK